MSKNKSVKVHSFSGATTEDMESHLIPLVNKKPDHILLHVGTNNLATDTPEVIVEKLFQLVNKQRYTMFSVSVNYEAWFPLGLVSITRQMPRPRHKNKAITRLDTQRTGHPKILSQKQNSKKYPPKHYSFGKS